MNLTHLIMENELKLILNRQISICFAFLKPMVSPDCNKKALLACTVLLAQLAMQDAINQLAKNDEELDQFLLNEVLQLVAKTAEKVIENDGSEAVMRLKWRSKKLKNTLGVRFLQIWEMQYLLVLGTGLPREEVAKRLPEVLGWLSGTTQDAFDFIDKTEPLTMIQQAPDELNFGLLDLNAPSIRSARKNSMD